jgi:hypothetical protein
MKAIKKVMKKGGASGCPPGHYVEYSGGPCIKKPGTFGGPSVKVAGAILGGAGAAIGSYLSLGKKDAKKKAKATAKDVANTAKTLTSKKPMRSGGAVGKRMTTKRK